jgi:hypothetical protein
MRIHETGLLFGMTAKAVTHERVLALGSWICIVASMFRKRRPYIVGQNSTECDADIIRWCYGERSGPDSRLKACDGRWRTKPVRKTS